MVPSFENQLSMERPGRGRAAPTGGLAEPLSLVHSDMARL
jgi:hypothetical protein